MAASLGVFFHTAKGCKGIYTSDASPAEISKGQDWTMVSTAGAIPGTTKSIDIVVHAMGMNNSATVYILDFCDAHSRRLVQLTYCRIGGITPAD